MTTAFLAVVLGPVLLGALCVAGTVATASRHQSEHRLNLAAEAVRTSVGALCRQLHATAGALAVLADPADRTGAAGEAVTRGLAAAVLISDATGVVTFATPAAPAQPWASCTGPVGAGQAEPRALAARVDLRDRSGAVIGAVWAAQVLDEAFVQQLAAVSGTAVTLFGDVPESAATPQAVVPPDTGPAPGSASGGPADANSPADASGPVDAGGSGDARDPAVGGPAGPYPGAGAPPWGINPVGTSPDAGPQGAESRSTESTGSRAAVLAAARRISGDTIVRADGGRFVRRVGPAPGQPLPLVLSVPRDPPAARYGPLGLVVLLTGVFAVLAAGRLARATTRPLAELTRAADRVAEGDLATRVRVRAPEEVGRLADSFNRMTREAESYLRALVISRHQLREQLAMLGDTLASTHDLHRILQVLLRAVMAATGARAGVVLLLDPRTGVLVGECAEGLDRRGSGNLPALRVPLGEGLLGRVAATGEPRRGRLDRDGPRLYGREPRCRTYVAVPLSVSGTGGRVPPPPSVALPALSPPRAPELERMSLRAPELERMPARAPELERMSLRAPEPVPVPEWERVSRLACEPVPGLAPEPVAKVVPETMTGWRPARPATTAGRPGPAAEPGTAVPARALSTGPLPSGGSPTIGVLALYDRLGADEFDDSDLVTLRSFVDHAAVAMENVRVHEEAQRLSLTDPLTGLWNYRYLTESVRREIERASRFGRMLSVLALDLDRFKQVNDTYGHAAGDAVLAEFAQRIRGTMREVDLAFRQGGEEFVVLLPETDARGAARVAERLGAAVRETPIAIRPRPGVVAPIRALVSVTVSIGVAVYPDHAASGPQLLVAADEALYAAKAAGRDTYRMASARGRLTIQEIPVRTGATPPDDGLPRAGGRSAFGSRGAEPVRDDMRAGPHVVGRTGQDDSETGPDDEWTAADGREAGPHRDRPVGPDGAGPVGPDGAGPVGPESGPDGAGPVSAESGPDGALSGPQPPRQGRGR
ncbi:diguanylate cyclase [Plantactinospora sp. WMMC1484]|uniref:diguanylate cyclase n=1 Tax=Plantactinospora sp. WMMC1484 TaxID=3404122 RepID=UPI003BF4EAD4